MERVINHIDKKPGPKQINAKDFDLFVNKNGLQGLALNNEILFTNINKIYSFRVRPENVIKHSLKKTIAIRSKNDYDRDFLEEYFAENLDNPFAIYFILTLFINNVPINKESVLTQFPPLQAKPEENICIQKFEELKKKIQPGDGFFTLDRNSNLSRKISTIDRAQWSHCGLMKSNEIAFDMTTSGVREFHISELDPINQDIAIYRRKEFINKTDFTDWYLRCEEVIDPNIKYNWTGVMKAYLYRKNHKFSFLKSKKFPKDATISDLINTNENVLIGFV